ncbi:MAG: type II toxin-antitoxin system VapC family toxin [Caulobacterales bacterium]
MTRYLLDTNIISEVIKPRPSPDLLAWMAAQEDADLFIATLTLAEIRRGILRKPAGRRRRELEDWYRGEAGPLALFDGRTLAFDSRAAEAWAELMAEGEAEGAPRSPLDMIIAAVAQANGCTLVSGNERHFRGVVELLNPMERA